MTRIRTMDFDAVAASAPLNREASAVRDGSGEAWDGKVPTFVEHWKAPPLPKRDRPEGVEDLSGRRVGRLTVVRYHRSNKRVGSQWLVRCDCGDYEVRRTTAITRYRGEDEACCQACDWLRHINWTSKNEGSGRRRAKTDAARLDAIAAEARR